MRNHQKHRKPSPEDVVPARERLDAYWATIELHTVLLIWIPAMRGLGAARRRLDRVLWRAVLAIGKAAGGPEHRVGRLLEDARDALDTVLITLDDLTPQGHVTEAIRNRARTRIFRLLARLDALEELPRDQWARSSQPRSAWAWDETGHSAPEAVADEVGEAGARGYSLSAVLVCCAAAIQAARRVTDVVAGPEMEAGVSDRDQATARASSSA